MKLAKHNASHSNKRNTTKTKGNAMLGTRDGSNSAAPDHQEGAGFMPSRDSGQLTLICVMALTPLHPDVHPANTKQTQASQKKPETYGPSQERSTKSV